MRFRINLCCGSVYINKLQKLIKIKCQFVGFNHFIVELWQNIRLRCVLLFAVKKHEIQFPDFLIKSTSNVECERRAFCLGDQSKSRLASGSFNLIMNIHFRSIIIQSIHLHLHPNNWICLCFVPGFCIIQQCSRYRSNLLEFDIRG